MENMLKSIHWCTNKDDKLLSVQGAEITESCPQGAAERRSSAGEQRRLVRLWTQDVHAWTSQQAQDQPE